MRLLYHPLACVGTLPEATLQEDSAQPSCVQQIGQFTYFVNCRRESKYIPGDPTATDFSFLFFDTLKILSDQSNYWCHYSNSRPAAAYKHAKVV